MHLFRTPVIANVLVVEGDVKSQNMNFAKVDRRGGGRLIGHLYE